MAALNFIKPIVEETSGISFQGIHVLGDSLKMQFRQDVLEQSIVVK